MCGRAAADASAAQVHDPRSGAVGRGSGDNPFADLHGRWRQQGLSSRLARRNVARMRDVMGYVERPQRVLPGMGKDAPEESKNDSGVPAENTLTSSFL
jgi:hypothetical protein